MRAKQSGRGKESFLAKDCHQKEESNPTMVASCENTTWQGGGWARGAGIVGVIAPHQQNSFVSIGERSNPVTHLHIALQLTISRGQTLS